MRIALVLAFLLAAAVGAAADRARPGEPAGEGARGDRPPRAEKPKAPCTGCTLEVHGDPKAPMPLLVVLHGDREQAGTAVARWRAAAKQRGWALLSLQCPATEQCKTSWWQWDGDPQWIRDQVAKVAAQISIDRDRTYVAGWSGGATYLGLRAPAWHDTFAAIVIHGGGMAPREETPACPARALPVYFLVGDGNPLHGLARDLRDYFVRCNQDVKWDLIPGADHAKEDRALDGKRAVAILDWLATKARTARSPDGPGTSPASR